MKLENKYFMGCILMTLCYFVNKPTKTDQTKCPYEVNETGTQTAGVLSPVSEEMEPDNETSYSIEDVAHIEAYIKRFEGVARAEVRISGQLASVAMAQAINESAAGRSELAWKYNNHFGIKCRCKRPTKASCVNYADDKKTDRFVIYDRAWAGWRAHSILIATDNYKPARSKDWRKACWGLKEAGYATSKTYPQKLIAIIKDFKLTRLDK